MLDQNHETALSAFEARVTHHQAQNGDVSIHYASVGSGPLAVFIHGFPDHWLTWWHQMETMSATHRCVAMDLRGYNLSSQPDDGASYAPEQLVSDVLAVIDDCGAETATVIGHDWGGFTAWHTAMAAPERVSRLAIVNMPHPWAISRELATNPAQAEASAYVRLFQQPQTHLGLDMERLSAWIRDPAFRKRHDAAMERSNKNAMLNYYRTCFPAPPYAERTDTPPTLRMPTLVIHGLEDPYALPAGLNNLWQLVEGDLTIRPWQGIGHFVQQDAPERLTEALRDWCTA
jgi:pimeloyl-ACP methyl ester carboxylesterase